MRDPVFVTREADKSSREDSTVTRHDAADGVRVDPQIHGTDSLLIRRLLRQCHLLLIGKPQEILFVLLLVDELVLHL